MQLNRQLLYRGFYSKIMSTTFYDSYKPLRNKIRKYNSKQLILSLINLAHQLDRTLVEQWKYFQPCEILLLIKWAISEYDSAEKDQNLSEAICNGFIKNLKDLFELHRSDALSRHSENQLPKFLRQTAFQQFWLQPAGHLTTEIMARQLMLFLPSTLEKSNRINDLFLKKTGISIKTFFEISFMALARFLDEKNPTISISKDFFKSCAHSFTSDEINIYFKLLSLSFDEAKEEAKADLKKKKDKLGFQIFEQTPFTIYPFLREGDSFILHSPAILHYVIRYYVYDFLKFHYDSNFLGDFGSIFENYLRLGLDFSQTKYGDEKELKKLLPKDTQLVDFFIESDDNLVLIDAKATEMQNFTRATQDNEWISRTLKKNVIKGVKQCYQVAQHFKNKGKIYSIIVTYKELYLGGVGRIWDEFLKDDLEDFFRDNNIDSSVISHDNIYVISADDFDLFMKAIKHDSSNLIKILDQATKMDKDGSTGKLLLGQHIKDFLPKKDEHQLPYLSQLSDSFYSDMAKRFAPIAVTA